MANYLVHDLDKDTLRKRASEYGIPIDDGAFVMVLGSMSGGIEDSFVDDTVTVEGNTYTLHLGGDHGDHVEISQDVDLTGVDVIRLRLFVRGAKAEGSSQWALKVLVDGIERDSYTFSFENYDFKDFAIPVLDLTGTHTLQIRLELV